MTGSERLISLACRLCSISNDPQPPCSLRAAQALIINLEDIDDIRPGDGSIAELLIGCDSTVLISQDRARGLAVALKHAARHRPTTAKRSPEQACEPGLARIVKRRDGERQRGQSEPIFILVDKADQCIKFARAVYGAPWTHYVAEPVPAASPCRARPQCEQAVHLVNIRNAPVARHKFESSAYEQIDAGAGGESKKLKKMRADAAFSPVLNVVEALTGRAISNGGSAGLISYKGVSDYLNEHRPLPGLINGHFGAVAGLNDW